MFELDKKYLMRHKHMAFGGGTFEVKVMGLTMDYVKLNDVWHLTKRYLETRVVVEELD